MSNLTDREEVAFEMLKFIWRNGMPDLEIGGVISKKLVKKEIKLSFEYAQLFREVSRDCNYKLSDEFEEERKKPPPPPPPDKYGIIKKGI